MVTKIPIGRISTRVPIVFFVSISNPIIFKWEKPVSISDYMVENFFRNRTILFKVKWVYIIILEQRNGHRRLKHVKSLLKTRHRF